jgi:hypothetical protein
MRAPALGLPPRKDGVHPDDLGDDAATLLRVMDGVKAKGGSMSSASQQLDNPEGTEFTGDAVPHVAERLAVEHVAKLKESELGALLRSAAATTTAGAGGRTDGTRAPIPWKAACEENRRARKRDSRRRRASQGKGCDNLIYIGVRTSLCVVPDTNLVFKYKTEISKNTNYRA